MPAQPAPDPAAPELRSIYEAGVDYVWETLRRFGVRDADLEDVTHDVFVAVQRKLAGYDSSRPLKPWLFCFALRAAADYRGSSRVRREIVGEIPDAADPAPGPDDRLEAAEARELLLAALDTLALELRSVLVLHDMDGVPMPAIAAALGGSVNTHYSRLRLARRSFTAALRRLRLRRGA
ncbi:MAG TPA: sigma-70 family RNA polymerase sigma factor [Polyangia bacterium]|jgi:RNA polymerase sigma-70 factor (ECF subfamily)